jgi:hypothetical protein
MVSPVRRFGLAVLLGVAVLATSGRSVQAQQRIFGFVPNISSYVNPNPYISPYMTLQQYAYNTAVLGRAARQVPPWLYGYNPYPSPVYNYGPVTPPLYSPPIDPYAGAALSTGLGYGGGYGAALSTTPYGGSGGYGNTLNNSYGGGGYGGGGYGGWGYPDLNNFYGYMSGAAQVTMANAQYWKTIQDARLQQEKANQEMIITRRKANEEMEYERAEWWKRYDPEVMRRRGKEWDLDRARHDPPIGEILSGQALNTLYDQISRLQKGGAAGRDIPISPTTLSKINFTGQAARGNIGLLKYIKDEGKVNWPAPLQRPQFDENRDKLSELLMDAVEPKVLAPDKDRVALNLASLKSRLEGLQAQLNDNVNEMLPSEYTESKRYLNLLADTLKAFEDRKVGDYLPNKWRTKPSNVASLVQTMSDLGVRFAPSVPGDENQYLVLYRALQAFDADLASRK